MRRDPLKSCAAFFKGKIGMVYKDFEYIRIDSGIEIKKYIGSATSVIIPKYIDDLSVTSIGERAFNWCKSLTVVLLLNPNTIIGEGAFKDCSSALRILRRSIEEPVVEAPKTTVDSHYNQEEKSAEEISSDKGPPVIGCLFWIVVLLFILNFLFG